MDISHITSLDWIIMAILAVLSVLMLSGKGGFLLKSRNAKGGQFADRYDEKKTGLLLGIMLLLVFILEILNNFCSGAIPLISMLYGPLVLIVVVVFMYLIYKKCRK